MPDAAHDGGSTYVRAAEPVPRQSPTIPRWPRDRPRSVSSVSFHRRSSSNSTLKRRSSLAALTARIQKLQKYTRRQVRKMKWWQKVLAAVFVIASLVVAVLVTVYHTEILQLLLPVARQLRDWPAGWLILWSLCIVAAFPPMIGYSTSVSLAGFVYGLPIGWALAASGTIFGATLAFLACRYYFHDFAHRMVSTDKRFAALSLTLKHDGLRLLCMIRLCPLPYSISNAAISTFPTVKPWQFMVATAFSTPKLMIHVFIGTRLRMLAEEGLKMDGKTKAINYGSLLGGIVFGLGTGLLIYRRTVARARQLEHEERQRHRASRSSLSSGRPSTDRPRSGFTDFSEHAEEGRWQHDPRAAQTAALIADLLEGDEEDSADNDEDDDDYRDVENHDLDGGLVNLSDRRPQEELVDVAMESTSRGSEL